MSPGATARVMSSKFPSPRSPGPRDTRALAASGPSGERVVGRSDFGRGDTAREKADRRTWTLVTGILLGEEIRRAEGPRPRGRRVSCCRSEKSASSLGHRRSWLRSGPEGLVRSTCLDSPPRCAPLRSPLPRLPEAFRSTRP